MSDTWIYGHDCTKDHWFVCLKWMHDMVCKLYRSKAVKNKPTKLFRLWGLGPPADTKPQSCQCGPATQASPVPPAAQAGGGSTLLCPPCGSAVGSLSLGPSQGLCCQ